MPFAHDPTARPRKSVNMFTTSIMRGAMISPVECEFCTPEGCAATDGRIHQNRAFTCKRCDGPSPYGVGCVVNNASAEFEAKSRANTHCPCGHSVKPV